MKANEAPERLYLSENIYGTYLYQVPDPDDKTAVEYTRTDAFIEKAMKFLKEWDVYRVCLEGHKDWFIEQFKNYMKGE